MKARRAVGALHTVCHVAPPPWVGTRCEPGIGGGQGAVASAASDARPRASSDRGEPAVRRPATERHNRHAGHNAARAIRSVGSRTKRTGNPSADSRTWAARTLLAGWTLIRAKPHAVTAK